MFFTIGIQCKQYPLGFMCKRGQNSPSLPLTVLRIQYNHLTPLFLDDIYCFLLLSAYHMSLHYSPNHKAKDLQFFSFYFDAISDLQKNYKNRTKNSQVPFTQIPQMLTFHHIGFVLLPRLSSLMVQNFANYKS